MTSTALSRPARASTSALRFGIPAVLMLCAALLPCMQAFAKQSDRNKPIHVSAVSADASAQPNGVSHLKGDVVITQGTLKATSDLATVYFDGQSEVKRVVLTGHAHIRQIDDHGNLMTGQADSIDYNVPGGIAVLTGNAHVEQAGRGSASGETLVYDTKTSTMSARGSSDNRVHLVFKPRQHPVTDSKPSPPAKPATTASAPAASTPAMPAAAASTPVPAAKGH